MNKKVGFLLLCIVIVLFGVFLFKELSSDKMKAQTNELEGTVLNMENGKLTIQDKDDLIYIFEDEDVECESGDNIKIEYEGSLDKNQSVQKNEIVDYEIIEPEKEKGMPSDWQDNGIFKNYYEQAYEKLQELTLEEKIGQLLLVRYPDNAIQELNTYSFGGYLFFKKDFDNLTVNQVQTRMQTLQQNSKIPLLTAVDEEGGKVIRISSNQKLVNEPFKSSKELYEAGGFDLITQDTKEKSRVLKNLGINLNLAPVVDVSTSPNDYMYERAFGQDSNLTSIYAKTVIAAGKGTGVSYTLKHFPGYGNNVDTHTGTAIDNRSYEEIINNDLSPFKAGISAGAEAVLISHNVVTSIDSTNPASLSPSIHNLLRNELKFTGIIMTDDLYMGAVSTIQNSAVKALQSGNDLLITTDYKRSIDEIHKALENGTLTESILDKKVCKVLAWKYYKGLL